MSQTYTGGCACGAIRYQVTGVPIAMNHCQCRQCQRDSGTGHGSHMTFAGADVTLTGEASLWTVTGEIGTRKSRGFCGTCGAPVFISFPDMPDVFVVSAAGLDDPELFKPDHVIWTKAGHSWDHVDAALQRFEKMPPR